MKTINKIAIFVLLVIVGIGLNFVIKNVIGTTIGCFVLGLVLNFGGKKSGAQRQSEIKSSLPQATRSIQKSAALTAPSEDVRCVRCGAIVKQARKYCSNCGARMTRQTVSEAPIRPITTLPPRTRKCVRCGATVDASKRFCTSCGAQLIA